MKFSMMVYINEPKDFTFANLESDISLLYNYDRYKDTMLAKANDYHIYDAH